VFFMIIIKVIAIKSNLVDNSVWNYLHVKAKHFTMLDIIQLSYVISYVGKTIQYTGPFKEFYR